MTYKFIKPARAVRRVFLHCSASDNPAHDSVAVIDRWHKEKGWAGCGYHFFIRRDGTLELGRDLEKTPAAQEGNNTGTIAICLHGLSVEKFTDAQFATLRNLCGQIERAYQGAITFHGHCEVAKKTCPVFDYRKLLGLNANGQMPVNHAAPPALPLPPAAREIEVLANSVATLKLGSKGPLVNDLQTQLVRLGYFTGGIDGDFGKMTRTAVLSFQADNHLETDGKVGILTREALASANVRELVPARLSMSLTELAAKGSKVAKSSRNNIAIGALLGAGGLTTVIDQITDQAGLIQKILNEHGLLTGGVILAAGLFVAFQSWRGGKAYLGDHRAGKIT